MVSLKAGLVSLVGSLFILVQEEKVVWLAGLSPDSADELVLDSEYPGLIVQVVGFRRVMPTVLMLS